MGMYLREKIGNPEMFTGRKKELAFFLKWIEGIKKDISPSTAILSRRRNGKTALLQRLYNITFEKNSGVIPFFFDAAAGKTSALDFCQEFMAAFVYQYIAFKTRNTEYLGTAQPVMYENLIEVARMEGFDYLSDVVEDVLAASRDNRPGLAWSIARNAPRSIAGITDERIVQLIDEFQYLNTKIYWDNEKMNQADDFAAGYMNTSEYKNAPLLVTGTWIGWFQNELLTKFPGRFRLYFMEYMTEEECVEMIYNYSRLFDIPIEEATVYLMTKLCGGSIFYIASLFLSRIAGKDIAHPDGLLNAIEFETVNRQGIIKNAWMENILKDPAIPADRNAKKIVLYLCKHRNRQISRKELFSDLNLDITDAQLEQKLKSLLLSDLIEQGATNSDYQGIRDNIFDKVFRGCFQKDVQMFDDAEIFDDYKAFFERESEKYRELMEKYQCNRGYYAEYLIIKKLLEAGPKERNALKSASHNLPSDFRFISYESVWTYKFSPMYLRDIDIDIFARAGEHDYSIICDVKNRDTRKFSLGEAVIFSKKVESLKQIEPVHKVVSLVISLTGFSREAIDYFKEQGIAWSDDGIWLD